MILPDSTILLDYLQHRAIALVEGMTVDEQRMRANLELTHGALFSQRVLLALVAPGSSRDEAYRVVQELAQRAWDEGIPLRELLAADERAARPRPRRDLRLRPLHRATPRRSSPGSTRSPEREPAGAAPLVASRHVSEPRRPAPDRQREGPRDVRADGRGSRRRGRLLMVASDRISTYDAVHPTPIPDKGRC